MYLSTLLIDVGVNPDRPRPGRLWLRNLYHIHQRLCMAFPSDPRLQRDPQFLMPYNPGDFPEQRHLADEKITEVGSGVLKQMHAPRHQEAGFLFRIDPGPPGRAVILVQSASAIKPNWDYAFHNASFLLAASPQVKSLDPCFTNGKHFRFRLMANPTRRLREGSLEADGQPIKEKWIGKRVPIPNDQLFDWLARRAEKSGFFVREDSIYIQPGYIYVNKKKTQADKGHRLRSVRYNGVLKVVDPARFQETIAQGLGPGKAFGFGLLSLAPCQHSPHAEAT